MGTWGTKTFQTDIAFDWFAELRESADPADHLRCSLTPNPEVPLEARPAEHVACAAEIVAALLNTPSPDLHPHIVEWVNAHQSLSVEHLASLAIHALPRVYADDSELEKLWRPPNDSYMMWKNGLLDLLARLKRRAG